MSRSKAINTGAGTRNQSRRVRSHRSRARPKSRRIRCRMSHQCNSRSNIGLPRHRRSHLHLELNCRQTSSPQSPSTTSPGALSTTTRTTKCCRKSKASAPCWRRRTPNCRRSRRSWRCMRRSCQSSKPSSRNRRHRGASTCRPCTDT